METIMNIIVPKLVEVASLALCLLISWLIVKVKKSLTNATDSETAANIAKIVVTATEQMYQALHGQEKMDKALEMFSDMLASRNIHLSASDMKLMLESAVGEANEVFFTKNTDTDASEK